MTTFYINTYFLEYFDLSIEYRFYRNWFVIVFE